MAESKKKVVIITGANSGIGFKAAEKLCQDEYQVILACRDTERGTAAVRQIADNNPEADAFFMQVCVLNFLRILFLLDFPDFLCEDNYM